MTYMAHHVVSPECGVLSDTAVGQQCCPSLGPAHGAGQAPQPAVPGPLFRGQPAVHGPLACQWGPLVGHNA